MERKNSSPNSYSPARRQFLGQAAVAGVALVGAPLLIGCGGDGTSTTSTNNDSAILGAAKIAEALAVTMYTTIINESPFFASLSVSDQNYIKGARDEEMFHYNLLKANTGNTDAQVDYFFPTGMFTDNQITINTLVTLEDAFIAAYLIGVKDLSSPSLRVLAAQIMGVESDHRSLARVIATDIGLTNVTGLSGSPEALDISNNNVYERTYNLTSISQVVTALTPFLALGANTVKRTFNPAYAPSNVGLYPNPANG